MSIRKTRGPRLLAAVAVLVAVTAAACGSSGSDKKAGAGGSNTAGFPATVKAANGDVVIAKRPTRIVSLSATGTEMLYAIGAGKQVVAVDDTSNYPPGVPTTKLNALNPNVEAIAAYQPDLVVAADDNGGLFDNLRRLSIPALRAPAARTFDDSYAQIQQLGQATGHLAGLQNIADATQDKAGGYPQLSAEFVLQAKPDFIFLADTKCCGQTPATVAARPGWGDLPAVKGGHVVPVDDDIASRWGPRVPDFLRVIVNATKNTGSGSG